jgi:hypothetical protein
MKNQRDVTPGKSVRIPRDSEESLIQDSRVGISPAQQVEDKLVVMLDKALLPVSQVRSRARTPSRSHL